MPHWKTLFSYEHLGVQDLVQDPVTKKYADLVVTIKSIVKKEVTGENGKKDNLPVADLIGAKKPMIINKTNLKILEGLFETTDYLDYIGKTVTLYAARVKGKAGGIVDGLRIRDEKPNIAEVKLEELTPSHERWAGAKKALADGNTTLESIKGRFYLSPENEKLIQTK